MLKNSTASAEDAEGTSSGSGRSPGRGNGNPLQYSCLENPMDRVAWQTTVHRVAKSQTQLTIEHTMTREGNTFLILFFFTTFHYYSVVILQSDLVSPSTSPRQLRQILKTELSHSPVYMSTLVLCTLAHQSVSVHTMAEKNRELDS